MPLASDSPAFHPPRSKRGGEAVAHSRLQFGKSPGIEKRGHSRVQGEPDATADRASITAFHGSTALQPARQLSLGSAPCHGVV